MTISESYEKKLIKMSKELDSVLKNDIRFEDIVLNIIEDPNSDSYLKLISQLGVFKKNEINIGHRTTDIIELLYLYLGSVQVENSYSRLKGEGNVSLNELQLSLNKLIGLKAVKNQVNSLIAFNKVQKLRELEGLKKSNKTLHMAFLGNPGTAKTTVARIVGKMYKSLGLLSKGHFIEASRTDLVAEYQGQTSVKVRKLVNRAKGGVLFIDEAYSIVENEKSDGFGKESITELMKLLEDYRDDLVVIVAGYTDLMKNFFNTNPGLKSRFNTFIYFEDYSLDELLEIFKFNCVEFEYNPSEQALIKAEKWFQHKIDKKDTNFSNGRMVRNFFDDVIMAQSMRISNIGSKVTKEQLTKIIESDIPNIPIK
ncbi:AAA family ATPase [Weissella koreensis]|nr:AAA family ATPase [Weissella koreensis]